MFRRFLSKTVYFLLNVLFLLIFAARLFAAADPVTAEINVSGTVTLNGQAVISSTTIVSGNLIETSSNSTATVSLGKLGKVELPESSKLTLNFTEAGMDGFLWHGEVKIYAPASVAAEFTTNDMTAMADTTRDNTFRLWLDCAHTHVETFSGQVTMKRDKSEEVVQAGEEKVAGDISNVNCPVCPFAFKKKNRALLPGLFGAGLAGIIGAIIGGGGGNEPGGGGINVSPIQPS